MGVPAWRGYGGALPRSTGKGGDSQRPGSSLPVMGYRGAPQGAFRSCPGLTSLQPPQTTPGQAQQNACVPGSLRVPLLWAGGLREHPHISIVLRRHPTLTGGTCWAFSGRLRMGPGPGSQGWTGKACWSSCRLGCPKRTRLGTGVTQPGLQDQSWAPREQRTP